MRTHHVILGLVLALTAGPARAFHSYPVGSYHDDITRIAATQAGSSPPAVRALAKAVRSPDWDETRKFPRLRPNAAYRSEHHFDRAPGVSTAEAFRQGAEYVQSQLAEAARASRAGDPRSAIEALGRVLHAVQDLSSHSNLVMLPADQRQRCDRAVWSEAAPPDSLVLTGYDPHARDPERFPGDPYSHGDHALDAPRKNAASVHVTENGSTRFELAFEDAVNRSVHALDRFFQRAPENRASVTRYGVGPFSLYQSAAAATFLPYPSGPEDALAVGASVSRALIAPSLVAELEVLSTVRGSDSGQALVHLMVTGFPRVDHDRRVRVLVGCGLGLHPSASAAPGLQDPDLVLLATLGIQARLTRRTAARVRAGEVLFSSFGSHSVVSASLLFAFR